MRFIICCALLCAAVAFSHQTQEPGWDQEKSYVYDVQGHVLSGLGIGLNQQNGLQLGYKLKVTKITQDTLLLNPKNFKALKNCKTQCEEDQNKQLAPELLKHLQSPIELTIRQGKVIGIILEKGMPGWAVNIKKSQLAPFIFNTENQATRGNSEAREKTVYGQCKVQYKYQEIQDNNDSEYSQSQNQQTNSQQKNSQHSQSQNHQTNSQHSQSQNQQANSHQKMSQQTNVHKISRVQSQNRDDRDDSSEEGSDGNQQIGFFGRLSSYLPSLPSNEDDDDNDIHEDTQRKFCNKNDQTFEIVRTYSVANCENVPVVSNDTQQQQQQQQQANIQNRVVVTRYFACGPDRNNYDVFRIERQEENGQRGQVQQPQPEAVQRLRLVYVSAVSVKKSDRVAQISTNSFTNVAYNLNTRTIQSYQQPWDQQQSQSDKNQIQRGPPEHQLGWEWQLQFSPSVVSTVTVYEEDFFRGQKTAFDVLSHQCLSLPKEWNDRINSIDMPETACIVVFDNFDCSTANNNQAVRLERYTYGSQTLHLIDMKNKISSMRMCVGNIGPWH